MSTLGLIIDGPIRKSFIKRLLSSMGHPDECWNWTGHIGKNGYSYCCYKGKNTTAYRASWEHLIGPIPQGYEIDHLCKNPKCVNPLHLEPVTPYINNMRSNSAAAKCSRKTHCINGHAFDKDNTKMISRKNGKFDRRCKICHRNRENNRRHLVA